MYTGPMDESTDQSQAAAELDRRAQIERELLSAGERRSQALGVANRELVTIAGLARQAQACGIALSRVAELAGVSRVTLYKLLGEDIEF